jgi:DNA-binding PadR family transcriptional regulator
MREPTFLVLTALAGGRLHGYGVMQSVFGLSNGRVKLRPGTVYGALERLEADGLVVADGDEMEGGRLRRYFRLSGVGQEALEAEAERLDANARAAKEALTRLKGRPTGRLA